MRYLNLCIVAIFSLFLSYFLPVFINLVLKQDYVFERVRYSPVEENFMIAKFDRTNNTQSYRLYGVGDISQSQYLQNLPFTNAHFLIKEGKFPKKFEYYEKNPQEISKNSQYLSVKASENKAKFPPLYPVLSQNEFDKIIYEPYIIALGDKNGPWVVDSLKNKKDTNLSKVLSDKLKSSGFVPPAKKYFLNVSSMKEFDWGAFMVDGEDKVFHIKFDSANFVVNNTKIVQKDIINIVVKEDKRQEFYALLIAKDTLGLIAYGDYKFVKLPNDGYEPFESNLVLRISPVDKILEFVTPNLSKSIVMNLNYEPIKNFELNLEKSNAFLWLKEYILPFELQLSQDIHAYKFSFEKFSLKSLILTILLVLVYFLANFYRKKITILQSFIVLIFGIYGLISVLIFKSKKDNR
ncbi:MAG: DUF4857 domain-containing protein [Campylobacter sp.]|nr:DUF4857 domain-containing protein [Campylobacter sp.]